MLHVELNFGSMQFYPRIIFNPSLLKLILHNYNKDNNTYDSSNNKNIHYYK